VGREQHLILEVGREVPEQVGLRGGVQVQARLIEQQDCIFS
jgi:hypothetical protein